MGGRYTFFDADMGEFTMNIFRNIALVITLLAVGGNSWATGELRIVQIPPGARTELVVLISPNIAGPIPAICK